MKEKKFELTYSEALLIRQALEFYREHRVGLNEQDKAEAERLGWQLKDEYC